MPKTTRDNLTRDEVKTILLRIPRPNRENWVKLTSATVATLGESDALSVMTECFPDEKPHETADVIKSLHGSPRCSAGTLIELAKQNGFDASAFFKERAARTAAAQAPKATNGASTETPARERPARATRKEKAETPAAPAPAALAPVKLGECSLCANVRKPESVKPAKLAAVLAAIKAGKWRDEVAAVRAGTREKSTLPQCNAFGVYNERRADENLASRSGFIVLDYDAQDNPKTDFAKLKSCLAQLPFVLAAFTSPSGNGLKAIIRIPNSATDEAAINAARELLAPLGGVIDEQAAARKHFIVSDDSEAFISSRPLDEIPPLPASFEALSPDEIAVLFHKLCERFFFAGKESYYFDGCDGLPFKELSKSDATEEFTELYKIDRKTARRALFAVRKTRHVSRVFSALNCRFRGIHELNGERALVLSSPHVIEADEGQFPQIRRMLEIVFKDEHEQLWRFLAWLQHARGAFIRAVESGGKIITPVPVLMLLGTAGAGKDLLFQTIIRPSLGDRNHAPADTFPQEKQWLGGALCTECILGSEMKNLSQEERSRYKATLKQITSGSGFNAEFKGKDGFNFRGQYFITLLANIDDGGNCAASLPAIDEDFRDKFLALSLTNSDGVKAAFDFTHKQENEEAIRRELPAFLYWLETYFEIPTEWKDDRFGVKNYVASAAARAMFEVSREFDVLAKLEEIIKNDVAGDIVGKPLEAMELAKLIADTFSEKVLSARTIGQSLRKLAKEHPENVRWNGSDKHPTYTLLRPQLDGMGADEAAAPESPFSVSPFAGLAF